MELISTSDFNELAILDCCKIPQIKSERTGRRYSGYFEKEKAEKVLQEFRDGTLKVVARDLVSSIRFVKDRIFDSERQSGIIYHRE